MTQTITPQHLQQWLHDGREIALFDVREHGQYGAAHLFHGVSLPYSRLELDALRLAPNPAVRLVICDETGGALAERAAERLQALGYRWLHILEGGIRGWRAAGFELFSGMHVPSKAFGERIEEACTTPHISALELAARQARGERLVVLDGRPFEEYRKMNIPGAICCPNGELGYRLGDLVADEQTTIVVNCAGRTRSIIGAQTLINLGVKNPVYALENGTQGWFLADLPLEHGSRRRYPDSANPAGLAGRREAAQRLAARAGVRAVAAEQVAAWADDPERSLFLFDVRSAEEFAAGSLPGAKHAPGGQLIQATDLYVGVRQARIVVFDAEDIRAPIVASWLRQAGHDAHVLAGGVSSGLALADRAPAFEPPVVAEVEAATLAGERAKDAVRLFDLRPSMAYRAAHIKGARWSIRPLLAAAAAGETRPLRLLADDPQVARLAALELPEAQRKTLRICSAAPAAWRAARLPLEEGGTQPPDAECIDFLFFVHDRHAGNKAAARQYLAWELGLLAQLDARELAAFRPLVAQGQP
ncbi:Rhodanese-related sulfurtransferase [Azotobacter beijerinckii]|uniref:Rhodanese-related sulfurtransferase n=1 Tax=Azotobacter beijerinckii TaxID=170623 RepID=A0A1H6V797_9GAMM|nr:Rhodanese-related sulfurtransferase [Azotobacter beijerinckii]